MEGLVPNYIASVTIEHQNGLTRDRMVNTFAFTTAIPLLGAAADELRDRLDDFYNVGGEGSSTAIAAFLGASINRGIKPIVRFYDVTDHLAGTPAGSPVFVRTFNNNIGGSGAADSLPSECAVALSFHADFGDDVEFAPGARPRARDRGRVYIGPLTKASADTGEFGRTFPSLGVRTAILGAGKDLRDANDDMRWSVWSRTAARMRDVTSCSVDDAFDTQRRRGERALLKQTL